MATKIQITDDVKHLIIHSVPDALVSPTGNRFLALVQQLVDAANAAAPTTTVAPTTTAAPTTTV